eukprot:CAMPEP_0176432582 /NCGR_PEP_ID=MMETSP0127-20121128/15478_1 /TAXON_ID=938130 /ORGANISM="Platyophrya macrostoma, Strain WH" /LENGTH=362 /DNA_ID=CAMNT_0017814777 /DNA_START=65 /DNA_END=1153 /DNA_ORIENTATION=+
MADHAVGSKISLISKSDIRYEGYLHFINPEENTVGLKNVRMFGTEGRKGGGANEVAAGDQLYEFIIFRGGDIKDLTVYEDRPRDPAIVSATPAQPSAQRAQEPPRAATYAERAGAKPRDDRREDRREDRFERRDDRFERRDDRFERRDDRFERRDDRFERRPVEQRRDDRRDGGYSGSRRDDRRDDRRDGGYSGSRRDDRRDVGQHQVRRNDDRRNNDRRDAPASNGASRGRGGAYGGGRGRGNGASAPRAEAHTGRDFTVGESKEQFKEEFDFTKANEAYEQKKADFEKAKEDARAQSRAYDKSSSFFDHISCEAKDQKLPRADREEVKKTDAETFGSEMVSSLRSFRRGRGGRGRYGNRF